MIARGPFLCKHIYMISGELKVPLTVHSVLNKVTEYDIFMYYMTEKGWKLNKVTYSPFRKENNPSFLIGNRNGNLSFIDFTDTSLRGDCFTFVKLLFNMATIHDVLMMIDRDLGLGIATKSVPGKLEGIKKEYKQPEDLGKRYCLIQAITRPFNAEELEYWNGYHQDISDLRQNNIYAIKSLYMNKKLFSLKPTELVFGYLYDGHWKIYRPYADKKHKWVPNNVPLTTAYGLKNLSNEHNSLICKSLKDYMVCKKIYPYVCHVQNESLAAFSNETVDFINKNSKDIFYGGDSDKPGKDSSFAITNAFGFKHINPPDNLLPKIKDFADWSKEKGLQELKNHFVKKRLFGNFK